MKLPVGPLLSSGIIFRASVLPYLGVCVYVSDQLCFALRKVCEFILLD